MCQNIAVKTVVDGFVKKGFMFSAFDVTKFLRSSGSNIRHSDVNSAVKEMFRDGEMNGYLRDTKDVGAPVAPFIYYHQNADLDNYVTDWLENNPDQDGMKNDGDSDDGVAGVAQPAKSSFGLPTPVPPVSSVSNADASIKTVKPVLPKGVQTTDKEGRLYIAPIMTHSAGLVPTQTVWIVTDTTSNKLVIKPSVATVQKAWPLCVNNDGRIRICRTVLKDISGGKNVLGYKVSSGSGFIEVVSV